MRKRIVINADPHETRIAILEDNELVELLVERGDKRRHVGDIYKGRVNAVLPGHILTDRQVHLNEIRSKEQGISIDEYAKRVEQSIPMARFGLPEEIGNAVTFLCSERASYITGVSLQVDGGIIRSTF